MEFTEIKGENGVKAYLRKRDEVKLLHQQIESLRAQVEYGRERVKMYAVCCLLIGSVAGLVLGLVLYPIIN